MIAKDHSLWRQLEDFQLDVSGAAFTFTQRLASENGWSPTYANRVIAEYKRFIYLAMVAGHPVTPSDEVDQAWHLHLTYTRNYWDELCTKILRKPLHHGPTQGGAREDAKYVDWYAKTHESYQHHFGHPPPTDIWPASAKRFSRTKRHTRVDLNHYWLIPKISLKPKLKLKLKLSPTAIILALAAPVILASCTLRPPEAFLLAGSVIIVFVFIVAVLIVRKFTNGTSGSGRRDRRHRNDPHDSSNGCSGGVPFIATCSTTHHRDSHSSSNDSSLPPPLHSSQSDHGHRSSPCNDHESQHSNDSSNSSSSGGCSSYDSGSSGSSSDSGSSSSGCSSGSSGCGGGGSSD